MIDSTENCQQTRRRSKSFTITTPGTREIVKDSSPLPAFLALDKIYNRNFSRIRKFYWILVILVSIAVTGWQVGIGLDRYSSMPIATSVTMEPLTLLTYPTVTICKDSWQFYRCLDDSLLENYRPSNTIFTEDEWISMWNRCGINGNTYLIPCNIAANVTECYNMHKRNISLVELSFPQTVFGRCLSLKSNFNFKNDPDRAGRVYFRINIFHDWYTMEYAFHNKFLFYNLILRDDSDISSFNIYYQTETIYTNRTTYVYISEKEVHYLNTTTNPCQTEAERQQCKTSCLTKILDKQINCRLLYMNSSKLQLCKTYDEYYSARQTTMNFYESAEFDNCDCFRSCHFRAHQVVRTYSVPYDDKVSIELKIQDKVKEIVTEFYSYSFSTFVSDAAGNIGFFLGASLVAIMELVESVTFRIFR